MPSGSIWSGDCDCRSEFGRHRQVSKPSLPAAAFIVASSSLNDLPPTAKDTMMSSSAENPGRRMLGCLLRAGLLTSIVDGLFSSVLAVGFYDSTVVRLFQGVASTVLGPAAFEGGAKVAAFGIFLHIGVAFTWSAVFLGLVLVSRRTRELLVARHGVIKVAAVYGPFIWMFMSLVVIPVLTAQPPSVNVRWWIQFVGHVPFVGIPIVASIGPAAMAPEPEARRA